jgi:hypothetical protein
MQNPNKKELGFFVQALFSLIFRAFTIGQGKDAFLLFLNVVKLEI